MPAPTGLKWSLMRQPSASMPPIVSYVAAASSTRKPRDHPGPSPARISPGLRRLLCRGFCRGRIGFRDIGIARIIRLLAGLLARLGLCFNRLLIGVRLVGTG